MSIRRNLGFAEGFTVGLPNSKRARATGGAFRGLDWKLVRRIISERQPVTVHAGLAEDWACTSGLVFANGEMLHAEDACLYTGSWWATPVVVLDDGLDSEDEIVCCVDVDEAAYNPLTAWPQELASVTEGEE